MRTRVLFARALLTKARTCAELAVALLEPLVDEKFDADVSALFDQAQALLEAAR